MIQTVQSGTKTDPRYSTRRGASFSQWLAIAAIAIAVLTLVIESRFDPEQRARLYESWGIVAGP